MLIQHNPWKLTQNSSPPAFTLLGLLMFMDFTTLLLGKSITRPVYCRPTVN